MTDPNCPATMKAAADAGLSPVDVSKEGERERGREEDNKENRERGGRERRRMTREERREVINNYSGLYISM